MARANDLFEQSFCANLSRNDGPLWLGSSVCDLIIQRQKDYIQPSNSLDLFLRVGFYSLNYQLVV